MKQVNIAQAKAQLSELVRATMGGREVVIARDNKPLVKLVRVKPKQGKRLPGCGKGEILFMSDDFDAPLDAFKDYEP